MTVVPTRSRLSRGMYRRAIGAHCSWGGGAALELSARARAAPRWLWLAGAIYESTTLVRGSRPSLQDCGATCQLRPPTPSRLSRGTHGHATKLHVCGEEAQHSSLLRTRAAPRELWLAASSNAQPAVAWRVRTRHWPWLFLGRERTTRAYCAHAPCRAGYNRLMLPARTRRW